MSDSAAGSTMVIGSDADEVTALAHSLDAIEVRRWGYGSSSAIEEWRERVADGPAVERVAVAMWPTAVREARPMLDVDDDDWAATVDEQLVAWVAGLGAAVRRCGDGGRIVAVVERPAPLDIAGRAAEAGIADAVEALVRSLARAEGARGVRVNAVTTPTRIAPAEVVAPAPPLAGFPGSVDPEVAAAAAMLLGPGVAGVTGTVVHADCGRSWR